jgi:hypothetical protein
MFREQEHRQERIGVGMTLWPTGPIRGEVRQGLALAVAGAALGIVGALIVLHLMAGLLFGVTPTDPLTFVASRLCSSPSLAAGYIPTMRAMRVHPMTTLHS